MQGCGDRAGSGRALAVVGEVAALATATLALLAMLCLPGAAIAARTGWFGAATPGARWGVALLCGTATLPALLSVVGRLLGIWGAAAMLLAVMLACAVPAWRLGRPQRWTVAGLGLAMVVTALEFTDVVWGGALYRPMMVVDLVKHLATVNALVSWDLPLTDPFVARPQPAGYYYFFYMLPAIPVLLTERLIDARAAFGGGVVAVAASVAALVALVWRRMAFAAPAGRATALLLALLLCGSLDIFPAGLVGLVTGRLPVALEQWSEQATPWLISLLWVPHHVMAAAAGVFALLVVAEGGGWRRVALAGLGFASCAGASVWVGLTVALTALIWMAWLALRREFSLVRCLAGAGLAAAALLLPLALDLVAGRNDGGFPIALTIRQFAFVNWFVAPGVVNALVRLVLLPLNYLIALGTLLVGSVAYWRRGPATVGSDTGRILVCGAAAGLLLGTFTRSTILSNDLGWRAMLLPQLAAVVWTAAAVLRGTSLRRSLLSQLTRWPAGLGVLLVMGFTSNTYELIALRAYPLAAPRLVFSLSSSVTPETDHDLRIAYEWANAHIPRAAVLQHNPARDKRAFDFGLYSLNRVAVADREAMLFGASKTEVERRLAAVGPIFSGSLPAGAVHAIARDNGIDVLVVTAEDTAWSGPDGWVQATEALLALPRVRLIAGRDLASHAAER